MILYVDTTGNEHMELAAILEHKVIKQKFASLPSAEDFSGVVKRFMHRHNLEITDINKIAVKTGPGFFSRIRTGVVFANALVYGLKITIVEVADIPEFKKVSKLKGKGMMHPSYSADPHITQSKKKYGFQS